MKLLPLIIGLALLGLAFPQSNVFGDPVPVELLISEAERPVPGAWSHIDPSTTDPDILNAMAFGAQWVGEQSNLISGLSKGNASVSQVWEIQQQATDGTAYLFNVSIVGDDNARINAQYVVFVQPWTNTSAVLSYSYEYDTSDVNVESEVSWTEYNHEYSIQSIFLNGEVGTSDLEFFNSEEILLAGGWISLDPNTALDVEDVKSAFDAGVSYVTQRGMEEGTLNKGEWNVRKLLAVSWEVVEGLDREFVEGINYAFDAHLYNGAEEAWVSFVVWKMPGGSGHEVLSWGFQKVSTVPVG